MPYSTCEDDVKRILTELHSENHCIDYKLEPYKKETFPEFIRDVIAFLNCEESLLYDRYIICGVSEHANQRELVGLEAIGKIMPDDGIFQSLIRKIRPQPIVHTGTMIFQGKIFGYIHILKENTDRTYEVAEEYPTTKKQFEGNTYILADSVHVGQAYIRRSTSKKIMDQLERRRIESQVFYKPIFDSPILNTTYEVQNETSLEVQNKTSLSIDQVAALIGKWNSNYSGDKNVLEVLSGLKYKEWECEFQRRIARGDDRIIFNQGVWSYEGHGEALIQNAKAFFDPHISDYFILLSRVLLSYNAKYDLPSDQRFIKSSSIPSGEYSDELRESIIQSFVILATKEKEFTSCTKSLINNKTHSTITKLFKEGTWKIFATLNWKFVDISQANPNSFCSALQELLKAHNKEISKYLTEKEAGIVATGYYHGLVSALQTLTWSEKYFSIASSILFSLTLINEEIKNSFVAIFLPWYPQTEAPLSTRVGVIRHLVAEYDVKCWDVIFDLMPRQTLTGMDIHPPAYIEGIYERNNVLIDEYWSVSEQYLDLLISIACKNFEYSARLIDLLDDVTPPMFKKILNLITDTSAVLENDNDRYLIWDRLLNFTDRHRSFADSDWALPEESLQMVDSVTALISPRNVDVIESRLFKREQYDLYFSNKSYHFSESELQILQTNSIKRIYLDRQINGVLEFVKAVGSPQIVGSILSGFDLKSDEEDLVLDRLQSDEENLKLLSKGYCNSSYKAKKINWLSSLNLLSLPTKKMILILSSIHICKDVLDFVKLLSEDEQKEYWRIAAPWAEEDAEVTQTIEGLLEANRLEYALMVLTRMIESSKLDSPDLAYRVLDANLKIDDTRSQMWSYYIEQVFTWLQKDMKANDLGKLVHYEWCYYRVLSHEGRAQGLEYTLSSSPEDFLHVLGTVYKSDNELGAIEEQDQAQKELPLKESTNNDEKIKLAEHAWHILYEWKWVPGVQLDGSFNATAFTSWIESVKLLSMQKGLYDIALQTIGHVLYYAPSSDDGFFILHKVAETFEKDENEHMRVGYRTEAFNARGVYNYDPSGKEEDELAKLWNERAVSAESFGYLRFGKTLRDIAQSFLDQKEHY